MKSVLIFVLSSHNPPYDRMIGTSMSTWDAEWFPGTTTIYYCGKPVNESNSPRVVSFGVEEDYCTIGYKNLLAYDWALKNEHWDYMARVNASCYVHKRRLVEHVQALPDKGVMRGLISGATPKCGVSRRFMWGGGQFIMSRDVVQAMVDNAGQWRHDLMEDVAMSELAQDCRFELDGNGRVCSIDATEHGWNLTNYNGKPGFEFTDFAEVAEADDQFFFRVKQDYDRARDADVMRALKENLPT